jgi:prophage antirepressor-like protein
MLATTFNLPTGDNLPAFQNNKGEWFFSAQDTCIHAEISSSKNAAAWVKNNIPSKWYLEIKIPGKEGRPSLYLSKPGFYFAVCQGKSLKAMSFRDWVFEDLLLKLESQGLYIPKQNDETLAQYNARNAALVTANNDLLWENRELQTKLEKKQGYIIKVLVAQCRESKGRITYKKIFDVLQAYLSTELLVDFHEDRRKYILSQWGRGLKIGDSFYETASDIEAFFQCCANNYAVPDIGGSGQQYKLKEMFDC